MDSDAALPRVPIGYENALLKHTLALLTNGLVPPGAMLLPQAPMNKMNWMPAQMGNENMAPGPSEGPNMRPGPSGFVPRPNGNQRRAERRRNDEEDSNYFDSDNLNSADERDL
uniref:Mediator complex subunit 4 n=2 Tax=Bursaphelenchus xylophilus TaxID=6326 RepID=A0A1I7SPC4_BURXY